MYLLCIVLGDSKSKISPCKFGLWIDTEVCTFIFLIEFFGHLFVNMILYNAYKCVTEHLF